MKIRPSIFLFVALAVVAMVLVFWYGKKPSVEASPTASVETNAAPPATAVTSMTTSKPIQTNGLLSSQMVVNATTPPNQAKGERMKEGLATLNDVPIVFYGRLEDQFDSPVVDGQIAASIRIENGIEHTVKRFSLTSDAKGFFTISGYKGQDLSVVPKKTGYVLASLNGGGIYSHMWPESQRIHPDPNNPVIIKMWKLQGAEPLVDIGKEYKIPYTSQPIYFDLVEKQIVPSGGDLTITMNRPDGIVSEQHPQPWGIDLAIIDGGFIETSDGDASVTFAAPEDGYKPNGTFSNNNGVAWFDKDLFVRSRNGQVYCKLNISFRINKTSDDLMYIRFSGVANTNNSRNWEATAPQ